MDIVIKASIKDCWRHVLALKKAFGNDDMHDLKFLEFRVELDRQAWSEAWGVIGAVRDERVNAQQAGRKHRAAL